jgi:hypothetical protein
MKKIITLLLSLSATLCFGAAGDVIIKQVNSSGTAVTDRVLPLPSPAAFSLYGTGVSPAQPAQVLIGSGLQVTGTSPNYSLSASGLSSFSSGNLSPIFSTSVANPTTTPALSFSLTSQSPNAVLVGPSSGGAAAPTFRSLVANDIPSLSSIYQPLNSNLTVIGGISPSEDNLLQYKSGAWASRTLGQVWSDLMADPGPASYAYTGLPFGISTNKRLLGRDAVLPPGTAQEIAIGTSLDLTSSTLNAIQDIRTSASPSFTDLSLSGTVTTGAPSGGSASAWKLGSYSNGTVQIQSGATSYRLVEGASSPIYFYVKNISILTTGAPADIGTITIPSWITRYAPATGTGVSVARGVIIVGESLSGTTASATFVVRDAASGGGNSVFSVNGGGPTATGTIAVGATTSTSQLYTSSTLYINQTANSANAGTISVYVLLTALP